MALTAEDEAALRQLVFGYARCADTRDGEGFAALFSADGVLEGARFRYEGTDRLRTVTKGLEPFLKTYHTVHNCFFKADGSAATGVIYSSAHHLTAQRLGGFEDYVMYITYHDRYARDGDGWRIANRKVVLEFSETKTVWTEAQ